jgi:hypothetical protein
MFSEKDFPGLQHSPTRRWLPSIHERLPYAPEVGIVPRSGGHCSGFAPIVPAIALLDQLEMRGWISHMNCISDFS